MEYINRLDNYDAPDIANIAIGMKSEQSRKAQSPQGNHQINLTEDITVMDTKLKIIEILEYIMDIRLDYRMSSLLSIFKQDFNETEEGFEGTDGGGVDLDHVSSEAEKMFITSMGGRTDLDLDNCGGQMFLRVLLHLSMHDYKPLVSGALPLLLRHFSQRQEVLQVYICNSFFGRDYLINLERIAFVCNSGLLLHVKL